MGRPIGFSTGALAKGDFRRALHILRGTQVTVVELSALRWWELEPLVSGIPAEDLSGFSYIAVHAPSRYEQAKERVIVSQLMGLSKRGWSIVAHPDAIFDFELWKPFGGNLLVENMDMRKHAGRTVRELQRVFNLLPDARFCFDAGHARQVDPTMSEAMSLLSSFGSRLRQLHVSEVSTTSRHERLTMASVLAFGQLAPFIPNDVPLVLETPVREADVLREIRAAAGALPPRTTHVEAKTRVIQSSPSQS